MLGEGLSPRGSSGIRVLTGDGHSHTGIRVLYAMLNEVRFWQDAEKPEECSTTFDHSLEPDETAISLVM